MNLTAIREMSVQISIVALSRSAYYFAVMFGHPKALGRSRSVAAMALVAVSVAACKTAQEHAASTQAAVHGEELTVGIVQREIRVGMSGAEVATVLGSPNVVTTDELRREVWIYDKVSTTRAYSSSSGGVSALILGGAIIGAGLVGAGGGGNFSSGAGAQTTSQKTLTIIIKFDKEGLVRDFAYHSSKF